MKSDAYPWQCRLPDGAAHVAGLAVVAAAMAVTLGYAAWTFAACRRTPA